MKNIVKKYFLKPGAYLLYVLAVVVVLLEITLRIWKPVPIRLKGNKILLDTNTVKIIHNDNVTDKLDKKIVISTNSLGFRGPEPPLDFSDSLSILTIGGSTTESVMISDGKTWPSLLSAKLSNNFKNLWLNNAGIDGQSSFGHIQFLSQYVSKIKPKVAIYLIGINDMAIDEAKIYDKQGLLANGYNNNPSLIDELSKVSDLVALYANLKSTKRSRELGLSVDRVVDYRVLGTTSDDTGKIEKEKYNVLINNYKDRLRKIIEINRQIGVFPIFLTQPVVYGYGTDLDTQTDLGSIIISDFTEGNVSRSGKAKWEILQMYNTAMMEVAREEGANVIDLADLMPKNSKYYYDFIHFSNKGTEEVADLIYPGICSLLSTEFPSYLKNNCPQ